MDQSDAYPPLLLLWSGYWLAEKEQGEENIVELGKTTEWTSVELLRHLMQEALGDFSSRLHMFAEVVANETSIRYISMGMKRARSLMIQSCRWITRKWSLATNRLKLELKFISYCNYDGRLKLRPFLHQNPLGGGMTPS